jgi:hypothetical protein
MLISSGTPAIKVTANRCHKLVSLEADIEGIGIFIGTFIRD